MDLLAESRLTFRLAQGHTVQPVAMVSGKQVCRHQDVSKESQTRGHCVRIVWQIEAQQKCAFVRVVPRPSPAKKSNIAGHTLAGEGRAVQHHMRHSFSVSAAQATCDVVILPIII